MAINLGPGLQQLSQAVGGMASTAQAVSTQKANMAMAARQHKYNSAAILADTKLQTATYGWLKDAKTKLATGEMKASDAGDELSQFLHETFSNNSSAWFGDEELAGMFEAEALEPFIAKMYQEVDSIAIENDTLVAVNNASSAIKTGLESLSMGANPDTVYQVLTDSLAAKRAAQPMSDEVYAQELMEIDRLYDAAVATNGIQGLVTSGLSEDKVLSAVDALVSGKETETTEAILASMRGTLDPESAEEMKKNVIKLNDDLQKSRMDTLNSTIYEAKHSGKLFDTTSIDELIEKVPTRHKVDLYKAKETATVYNDGVYEEVLERGLSSGKPVGDDWWDVLDLVSTSSIKSNLARQALTSLAESQPSKEAAYNAIYSSRASLADKRTVAAKYVVDNVKSDELTYEDMVQTMFAFQNGQQILPQLSISFDPETITVKDIEKDISSGFITGKQEKVSIPTESGMVEIPAMDEVDIPKEYEQAVAEEVIKQIGFELPPLQHHGIKSSVLPKASFSMNAVEQPTIDASALPTVENEEGTVSTVDTISIEEDGKEVLIPTIVEGERVSDEEAVTHYKETNEHFGKYNSVDEANEAAEKLHESEEQRVQAPPMDAPSSMNAVAEEDAVVEDAVDRTKAQEYAKQLVERYRMLLSTADAVGQLKSDVERIKAKKTKFQKETVEVPEEEDTVEAKSYDQGYRTPIGTTVTDTPSDTADKQYLNGMAAATFITMKEPGLTPEKKFMSVNPNSTQKEIADAIVYNAVNGMSPSTQDFMLLDPDGREIVRDLVQQVFRGEPVMSDYTVLNQVIQLWKDNTIPEASLKEFIELSYRFGNLTKDDADMYGSRPTWMANGRFSDLDAIIKKKTEWLDIVDQIHIKNEIYRDVVENPSSMADDRQFQSYTEQVGAMVGESSAKKYLEGIETVSKAMDDPDSIKALTSKHVSTFAIEARDGKYDLAIDMSLQDGPLKVFGGTFDQMVDYISKEMYGKSYDDIEKDTDGESVYFRQSRVMANAMFKQLGNVQMETFSRYMGFSPKSLQRVGNTWAFEDSAVKGLFYRMGNFASDGGSGGVRWEVFTMDKKNGAYDPSTIGNIAYIPEVMVDIEKELSEAKAILDMAKGLQRSQREAALSGKWWMMWATTPPPSTGGIQMRPDFTKDIRDAQQVVDDLEKKKQVRDQFILGVREQLLKNNR